MDTCPGTDAGAVLSEGRADLPVRAPQSRLFEDWQILTANRRQLLAQAYDRLAATEPAPLSRRRAAGLLQAPLSTLHELLKLWQPTAGQPDEARYAALIPGRSTGRPGKYKLEGEELAAVRAIYARLDESEARGRGLGSSRFVACRLAAQSEDPRITPEFRALINSLTTRSLPGSIASALDTPTSILARVRDRRSTLTTYVSTPRGRTWVDEHGREHPTRPGDCLSADDGTVNFYAWIPWPFGGDKCSDKYGVKLGKWQLLTVIDDRSEMCLAFDVVARQSSAYRAADVAALMGRAMIDIAKPQWWLLERGSWESDHVKHCLSLANTRVKRAWESKQKSAVERTFDRLWTPLSLVRGHAGRDRGRFKQITDIALACQSGARDPREWFDDLPTGMKGIIRSVEFINGETIESRSGWGSWVPQERWQAALAANPPDKVPGNLSIFYAREQRVRQVKGGALSFSCECPEVRFPVHFQCEELWEYEGCQVKAYFDPYSDPCLGTLVLEDAQWRGHKRGHIIARDVPALELAPQAVFQDGWTSESAERSLAVRKAIAKAVRTETWNYLGARSTTARDGMGNVAQAESGGVRERGSEPGSAGIRAGEIARPTHLPTSSPPRSRSPLSPPTEEEFARRSQRAAEDAALARALE